MATHWLGKHSRNGLQVVAATRSEAVAELSRIFGLQGLQRASLGAALFLKLPKNGSLDIETCDCSDGTHTNPAS